MNDTLQGVCFGGDVVFRYLDTHGVNQTCIAVLYHEKHLKSTVEEGMSSQYPLGQTEELILIHRRGKKGSCFWPSTIERWRRIAQQESMFNWRFIGFAGAPLWLCLCCACCAALEKLAPPPPLHQYQALPIEEDAAILEDLEAAAEVVRLDGDVEMTARM